MSGSEVVGRPPSAAGVVARRAVAASTVVRRGVDSPVARNLVTTGVDSIRRDARAAVAVARDIAATAPRDALAVARTTATVARVATPPARAVGNYVYDRALGWVEIAGGEMVANLTAWSRRAMSGDWLDFSRWGELRKYRTRWDP